MVYEPDVAAWFGGAQRVLFVHAHPDDESIFSGGTIAGLAHTGRDVSVLTLTRGERGEVLPSEWKHLEGTPHLAAHRSRELERALRQLGVRQAAFLGSALARGDGLIPRRYRDSGMQWGASGRAEPAPDASDDALSRADVLEVARDVMAFARATRAEVLVTYDEEGGYGHPDHVMAHQATRAAARELNLTVWSIVSEPADAHAHVTHVNAFAVERWLDRKRAALAQHASQLALEGSHLRLSGGQLHEIAVHEFFVLLPQ